MSASDEPREQSQKILDGVLLTLDARKVASFIEQRDAIVEMLNLDNMPVLAAVLAEVAKQDAGLVMPPKYGTAEWNEHVAAWHLRRAIEIREAMRLNAGGAT